MPDDPKSPAEELVDLVVFGPLGLALEYLERFPDFVQRGRKQANFAQSIGKMALGGFARRPAPTRTSTPAKASEVPKRQAPAPSTPVETQADEPLAGSTDEPLPGYAAMTAREVIAAVEGLSLQALTALEAAETAGKNRVTVLRAVQAQRTP